ncbi:hypothetical protein T12_12418 [Trichinella patagoniensis]|uniref:Uncharacterized protein n=1 Tax=Trichinella patagoniensis TaxID=990121 RepID=A0A0V0ZR87_9BILA|nr:hypothetical protein T12_12418 [Trichinella patagoniensis]
MIAYDNWHTSESSEFSIHAVRYSAIVSSCVCGGRGLGRRFSDWEGWRLFSIAARVSIVTETIAVTNNIDNGRQIFIVGTGY